MLLVVHITDSVYVDIFSENEGLLRLLHHG